MFSIKSRKVKRLVAPSAGDEAKADQLVERLRDLVLQNNSNGEFATLGITPRVFVKNFEQRMHHLITTRQEQQMETPEGSNACYGGQIHVDYAFRNKGTYTEGQLRLQLRVRDDVYPAITLLTFSEKIAGSPFFQELLPQVKSVLDDFFPVVVMHNSSSSISASSDNVEKGIVPVADRTAPRHQRLERQKRALACGGELGAALAAYKQKGSQKKAKKRNASTATSSTEKLPHHHSKTPSASLVVSKEPPSNHKWHAIRVTSVMAMVAFYFWFLRPSL